MFEINKKTSDNQEPRRLFTKLNRLLILSWNGFIWMANIRFSRLGCFPKFMNQEYDHSIDLDLPFLSLKR